MYHFRHQNGKRTTFAKNVRGRFSGTSRRCGKKKYLAYDSTIAASVGRPCVISVAERNPEFPPWDTSMMSESVTLASRK